MTQANAQATKFIEEARAAAARVQEQETQKAIGSAESIIAKAREFDAKDVVTDPDDASNPTDDAMISVLEDHRDDPVVQEIAAAIFAMNEDEQIDLVALTWLGRGDGSVKDWDELRAAAARAHNKRTASYLLGMPLLADYLNEALSQFGHSCDE